VDPPPATRPSFHHDNKENTTRRDNKLFHKFHDDLPKKKAFGDARTNIVANEDDGRDIGDLDRRLNALQAFLSEAKTKQF